MAKRIELASLITEASIKDPLLQQVIRLQRTATKIFKNTADNINIPPRDRAGLLNAFGDLNDQIEALGSAIEMNVTERAQMNEISDEAYERMDGLVNMNHIKSLLSSMEGIVGDLRAEGFEDDEIFDYIMLNIKTGSQSI